MDAKQTISLVVLENREGGKKSPLVRADAQKIGHKPIIDHSFCPKQWQLMWHKIISCLHKNSSETTLAGSDVGSHTESEVERQAEKREGAPDYKNEIR